MAVLKNALEHEGDMPQELPAGTTEAMLGAATSVHIHHSIAGAVALGPGASAEGKVQITAQTVVVGDGDVVVQIVPAHHPVPKYPDHLTQVLSEKLAMVRVRRQKLQRVQADTTALDREILDLKRQIRDGGQLRAGDSLGDGRYLLLEQIGRGGFGTVWKAHDSDQDETVAIKVLHSNLAGDPWRLARFLRGAKIMRELGHQAIVRILDEHGEDGGWHYFVMELIDGEDLYHAVVGGRLRSEDVVPLILHLGDALAAAHMKGIVHRDVKPLNILLDTEGTPRLTDFDLVTANTTGGTKSGALGTFLYAAPEQLHEAYAADARADVYSLGMTMLFCLHGADLPLSVVREPRGLIGSLPCALSVKKILQKSLSWNRDDRYRHAGEFCTALKAAVAPPDARIRDQRRWVFALAGSTAMFAGAASVSAWYIAKDAEPMVDQLADGGTDASSVPAAEPSRWPLSSADLPNVRGIVSAEKPPPPPSDPARITTAQDPSVDPSSCRDMMVLIPGGTFRLGSDAPAGHPHEWPAHEVTLSAFCIDRSEVSVA